MKKLVYAHLPILALRICIPPMVVVREFFLSLWQTPRHQESDLLGYQIVLQANLYKSVKSNRSQLDSFT